MTADRRSDHRIPGLCGIILAAGQSSRMGTQKPLLLWPPLSGGTLLSAMIAAFTPYTDAIFVVAGKNAELLAPVIEASGAMLVENPNPEQGQFSSLRIGLRKLVECGFGAAMISPIDSPPPGDATLQKLAASFRDARTAFVWGVAPSNGDKRGHPLLAGRELIDAFLNASADSNAKLVKLAHEEQIKYVEVGDPFVTLNINTPEEYAELCRSTLASPLS